MYGGIILLDNFNFEDIKVCKYDLIDRYVRIINDKKIVSWDIETSGLNWSEDNIGTCQLYTPNKNKEIMIIKINNNPPTKLSSLLKNPLIKKIFHHAMFDLRFMRFHWNVKPQNVACTKIASKLLDVNNINKHHLIDLLEKYLNVKIKKDQTKSNWLSDNLTNEQKLYAANDVYYLIPLLNALKKELISKSKNLWDIVKDCFNYIPTKVELEVLGFKNIYRY